MKELLGVNDTKEKVGIHNISSEKLANGNVSTSVSLDSVVQVVSSDKGYSAGSDQGKQQVG